MDILERLQKRHQIDSHEDELEIHALTVGWSVIDALAECRRQSGLTQDDVAVQMGTSQASVAKLENHRHDPRLSTVMRYAWALGQYGEPFLANLDDYVSQFVDVETSHMHDHASPSSSERDARRKMELP